MSVKEYQETVEKHLSDGFVKVGIPIEMPDNISREWVWAESISKSCVRIKNIPFFANEVGFEDLVEVKDGENGLEYVRVMQHVNDTIVVTYDRNQAQELYPKIAKYFQQKEIHVEGGVAGLAALAVPSDSNPQEIIDVIMSCPVPIQPIFPEE